MGTSVINLKNRTEYSFRTAFGSIEKVLATNQRDAAGMCDRGGTWGHVQWEIKCKEAKIKPIFGVELAFVDDMDDRSKQGKNYMSFLAKNQNGLIELYNLVTLATEKFYYEPRLDYSVLSDISDNIIILSGSYPIWDRLPKMDNLYIELSPESQAGAVVEAHRLGLKTVAVSDNYFPTPADRKAYEMVVGRNADSKSTPQHIINGWEWADFWEEPDALTNTKVIADMCNVELVDAEMVKPKKVKSLKKLCTDAAKRRHIDLTDKVYKARFKHEIDLIADKKFEDYFHVVSDMCQYAKKHMLVGPARGSSCGSLVCYLLEITEIDPIKHNLLFERFVDVNRMDYPDIDVDFPDDKRDMVIDYLKNKYGHENVARLGTISRFKAKSAIVDVSRSLKIPKWDVDDLKNAIVERSSGDARAKFCITDTFEDLDVGKRTLAKYPELKVAAEIEGHTRHTGQHSAGILITANPITNYCSVDERTGCAQIDKYDAEIINFLKIDCLGLRTLSVIQDTLDQIGWDREKLMRYPLDDEKAFEVLNKKAFAGIFQFEGYSVQSLCKDLTVVGFEDIAALTALARPGPLHSGGATEYIERKTGQKKVKYLHPLTKDITKVTYGVIIYQEQVMQIARTIGLLSWKDVSDLRKAMSKSLGVEFFDRYFQRFKVGAEKQGIKEKQAKNIWDKINTMGSWAFNRSHAVAYGTISYWCCVLKARYPLEFASACLRNAKDEEQSILILRELHNEGYSYKAYDKEKSLLNWSVQDGKLIGGLIGIKGIGIKTAQGIMAKRENGEALTPRQDKLLSEGKTPYDMIFKAKHLWGHIYKKPIQYDVMSKLTLINNITQHTGGEFVFIGELISKNLRDHNESLAIERRGGKRMTGQTLFLYLMVEDDTASVMCQIGRGTYLRLGLPIIEDGKIGDWYIWKGYQRSGHRKIFLKRWVKLTGNPKYCRPNPSPTGMFIEN